MKQIDKLAWIELQEQAILMARSYGKELFYIPGGKREAGESDAQALLREVEEELSVVLDEATLGYVGTFEAQAHGHPEGVTVRMTCYTGSYSGQLRTSSEIERIEWYTYGDKHKVGPVDKLIFDFLHQKHLLA